MVAPVSSGNTFQDYSYVLAMRGLIAWPAVYQLLFAALMTVTNIDTLKTLTITDVFNNNSYGVTLRWCLNAGLEPVTTLKPTWSSTYTNWEAAW